MPETSPLDRLQPFLLDRLTDDEPRVQTERPERRAVSARRYREAVLRDLAWLLNAKAHTEHDAQLEEFGEAAKSVLNYGMRDFAGMTASGVAAAEVERLVRNAILQFEPRMVRHSLQVRVADRSRDQVGTAATGGGTPGNAISLEIKGEIKLLPLPEPIYVRTKVDLETGHCELQT